MPKMFDDALNEHAQVVKRLNYSDQGLTDVVAGFDGVCYGDIKFWPFDGFDSKPYVGYPATTTNFLVDHFLSHFNSGKSSHKQYSPIGRQIDYMDSFFQHQESINNTTYYPCNTFISAEQMLQDSVNFINKVQLKTEPQTTAILIIRFDTGAHAIGIRKINMNGKVKYQIRDSNAGVFEYLQQGEVIDPSFYKWFESFYNIIYENYKSLSYKFESNNLTKFSKNLYITLNQESNQTTQLFLKAQSLLQDYQPTLHELKTMQRNAYSILKQLRSSGTNILFNELCYTIILRYYILHAYKADNKELVMERCEMLKEHLAALKLISPVHTEYQKFLTAWTYYIRFKDSVFSLSIKWENASNVSNREESIKCINKIINNINEVYDVFRNFDSIPNDVVYHLLNINKHSNQLLEGLDNAKDVIINFVNLIDQSFVNLNKIVDPIFDNTIDLMTHNIICDYKTKYLEQFKSEVNAQRQGATQPILRFFKQMPQLRLKREEKLRANNKVVPRISDCGKRYTYY